MIKNLFVNSDTYFLLNYQYLDINYEGIGKIQKAARILVKAVLGSPICIFIGYIDSLVRGFCLSSNL